MAIDDVEAGQQPLGQQSLDSDVSKLNNIENIASSD